MGNGTDASGGDGFSRRSLIKGAGAALTAGLVSTSATGLGEVTTAADTPPAGATAETTTAEGAVETTTEEAASRNPVFGANLNGRPHRLHDSLDLLDVSETKWVRAFLDIRQKIRDGRDPRDDPDVVALRRAAHEKDCKLVVSLKWDFTANWGDKDPMNVPRPGSQGERELCRAAVRYLESLDVPVDVVVLGNEPMWETLAEDIRVEDPPIVEFTRNVKDYLVEHGDHGDPAYLVGSFNRLHDDRIREQRFPHFYQGMAEWVRADEDVDGVDLHVHYDDIRQAEGMLAAARETFPDEVIAVTEISPIFRYARHLDTPIAEFDAGDRFARDYDLPGRMTVVDYFEYAKRNPRSPEEVGAFYDAMPWYNVNFVEDVYDLFADYDVTIGTFGFLLSLGMRNEDWSTDWMPFHINFLFQPGIMQTEHGFEHTAHPHYIEDYRERTA